MYFKLLVFSTCLFIIQSTALRITNQHSFIVKRSPEDLQDATIEKEGSVPEHQKPKIYEMRVDSNVTNRFAHTLVTSKVKNPSNAAQEAIFSIVLPKKAFITKFVMSIDGKDYEAYVKEKEEAKNIYDQAISSGQGAGLVAASARESNSFTVSVNVEPEKKVIFYLTYEQLLERENNQYELVINIHPKQPVKDLSVYVNINESQPLSFVKAPSIRSGNDVNEVNGDLDPRAQIQHIDANSAVVKFSPSIERQKELAKTLKTDVEKGLSGQFVVQYDVERNANGGEILLQDGYFVHFFAPKDIQPLPKYVLFVLDISGSMYGQKIEQLKAAMKSILNELKSEDKFHLITFESAVHVLNLHNESATVQYPKETPSFYGNYKDETPENLNEKDFVGSYDANPDNIVKAIKAVDTVGATGGTNIGDALKVALYLVEKDVKTQNSEYSPQPMIIFLTDGDATVGITETKSILSQVQEQNEHSVPIFSLSFGFGADRDLLQKLSLRNSGFSRHIYDAADASLQLQDFYKLISSPILNNITFKYVDEAKEVTKTIFPILFKGSELVVVGRLDKDVTDLPIISGHGIRGHVELVPKIEKPVRPLERLWAYLTIQQLLDDVERTDNKTAYERKALDLALKYSFVTPLTSLVVVKPNATNSPVVPQAADTTSTNGIAAHGFLAKAGMAYFAPRPLYSPMVYYTTRPPPPSPTTMSLIEQLKNSLPWLNDILNGDVISTPKGTYKLGLNETSTDDISCPATPGNNVPGSCKLLHECTQVYSLLKTVDIFQQYRCDMKGFAAVCCPST